MGLFDLCFPANKRARRKRAAREKSSSLSAEHSDPRSAAAVPILKETLRCAAALRQDSHSPRKQLTAL